MSKLIKIQKPKYIDDLENIEDIYSEFIHEDKVQNKIISNINIEDKNDLSFSIDSCIFKNVTFINCNFYRIDLIDSRFENCDLSNISFTGGSLHRCEFINCKLVGAKLDECNIKNSLFENVLGKYINFSASKFNSVNIIESNFSEGVFQEVILNKVCFNSTDLSNSYFNKTSLSKQNLTTCDITNIDVEIKDLYGTEVTAMQALDLTRLIGLTIK